jgi:hypothetical protein
MKAAALVFYIISFLSINTNAQTGAGRLSVKIITENKEPLDAATVEILGTTDSALYKTGITGKDGKVTFEKLAAGSYLLRVSTINFLPVYSSPFTIIREELLELPHLVMKQSAVTLKDVTVTAKKPFIQKLTDRIVVNVEGSIVSAGSSALDILERSPGITLDQNEAISLRGRAGVIIMIDGKITPMSGTDLANYLKGLPASAIERIDIITNPSSKYDAAGTSGIIDIRLKKDQRMGTNGTSKWRLWPGSLSES